MTRESNGTKSNEISFLYTIGVLLTILGHSHPNDWTLFPAQPVEFIYSFHMPLFFCVSGYLFMRSHSLERDGYSKWIGNKAKRLLIPYFVISSISIIPKTLLENGSLNNINLNWVLKSFFAPRFNIWGHFWFLPVIFVLYFLFGLWKCFFNNYPKHKKLILIITFITAIMLHFTKTDILWLGISDLCKFTIYFVIGVLSQNILKTKKFGNGNLIIGVLLLTFTSIVLFLEFPKNTFVMFLESILMLTACLLTTQFLSKKHFKCVDFINNNVFTFYICAWPFQAITEKLLNFFTPEWYIYTIVMFLIGAIAPCIIIVFFDKFKFLNCKFLRYLLGFRVVE